MRDALRHVTKGSAHDRRRSFVDEVRSYSGSGQCRLAQITRSSSASSTLT